MDAQPWISGDEVNDAIEDVLANQMGTDGGPATLETMYLRQVREARLPCPNLLWHALVVAGMHQLHEWRCGDAKYSENVSNYDSRSLWL